MTLSKTCYVWIHAYTLSEYLPPTHAYTHTRFRIFLSYKSSIPSTRSILQSVFPGLPSDFPQRSNLSKPPCNLSNKALPKIPKIWCTVDFLYTASRADQSPSYDLPINPSKLTFDAKPGSPQLSSASLQPSCRVAKTSRLSQSFIVT